MCRYPARSYIAIASVSTPLVSSRTTSWPRSARQVLQVPQQPAGEAGAAPVGVHPHPLDLVDAGRDALQPAARGGGAPGVGDDEPVQRLRVAGVEAGREPGVDLGVVGRHRGARHRARRVDVHEAEGRRARARRSSTRSHVCGRGLAPDVIAVITDDCDAVSRSSHDAYPTVALSLAASSSGSCSPSLAAPAGAGALGPDQPDNGSDPDRPATWGRTSSADHELKTGLPPLPVPLRVTAPVRRVVGRGVPRRPARARGRQPLVPHPRGPGQGVRALEALPRHGRPRPLHDPDAGHLNDGYEQHSGWVRPSHFRMTRR